jgi:hypothetical protein
MANYRVIALPSQILKGLYQWVKARPDYEPLFSILDGMRQDADRRFWIEQMEPKEDDCDIEENTGHMCTDVEIVLPMSDKTSTCLAIP